MVTRREALKTLGVAPLVIAEARRSTAVESRGSTVSISLSNGRPVSAFLAGPLPASAGAVMLIHEGRGLTPGMKEFATDFAREGFLALAVDLYEGKVPANSREAHRLREGVNNKRALETLVKWVAWLRSQPGANGKVGTVGWCYGGGWSLDVSIATPVQATVIYYGQCAISRRRAERLEGPVMGHFATRDKWINRSMVKKFERSMKAAEKTFKIYWYEAGHAFANPRYNVYDYSDAHLAWKRTVAFLRGHLS